MKESKKLSYASPKSKLNGIEDPQEMGGFWGTGTGSGCGTISTGISGEENIQVSHSFGGITWNGTVSVSYSAIIKKSYDQWDNEHYSVELNHANISYNFIGDSNEDENENSKTVVSGNSVFGSFTSYSNDYSSSLEDVTFIADTREYKLEGEEWKEVSHASLSETKRIHFSVNVINDYDATISISLI